MHNDEVDRDHHLNQLQEKISSSDEKGRVGSDEES